MSDLISRQDAINEIRKCRFVVDAIEKISGLPSAEPRWIPVSERLPEKEKNTYWVCTDGGCQCECRWTNINHFWTDLTTDWHWNRFDIPNYHKVVAWMPLPEPYKEAEHE